MTIHDKQSNKMLMSETDPFFVFTRITKNRHARIFRFGTGGPGHFVKGFAAAS